MTEPTDLSFVTLDQLVDELERRCEILALVAAPLAQKGVDVGTGERRFVTAWKYPEGGGVNALVALARLSKKVAEAVVADGPPAAEESAGTEED